MLDLFFPKRRAYADEDAGWYPTYGMSPSWGGRVKTSSGIVVDEHLAMMYAAVWCATRILSETPASFPLFLYRKQSDGGRKEETDDHRHEMVNHVPNEEMGAMVFREGRHQHQVNWGNGFAEIERDIRTEKSLALWPIHPSRVRPARKGEKDDRGRPLLPEFYYVVKNDDNTSTAIRKNDMLHIPGVLSDDGIWGKGVIQHARESIGFGVATERHGATYFGSGAQPRGIVKGFGMRDPEQRKQFRKEWKELHGRPDAGEIAIIPADADYKPITISNEDSQFLQTRKANIAEMARWYRLPLYMLAEMEGAKFNNVEHLGIEFLIYSLFPWLMRWQQELNLKLLTPEERQTLFFEFKLDALLRGDFKTRMEAYQIALRNGVLTLNQIYRLENLPAIGPEGDLHFFEASNLDAVEVRFGTSKAGLQNEQPAQEPEENAADDNPQLPAPGENGTGGGANGEASEQTRARTEAAAKAVLSDTLRRMFTKESNAATRAIGDKVDFDKWLEAFYDKHRWTLAQALDPAATLLASLGYSVSAVTLAGKLVEESRTCLRQAYDGETPERFRQRVSTWPTERVEITVTGIFNNEAV